MTVLKKIKELWIERANAIKKARGIYFDETKGGIDITDAEYYTEINNIEETISNKFNAEIDAEKTKLLHKYGLNMLPEQTYEEILKIVQYPQQEKITMKKRVKDKLNIPNAARVGYNYDTKMKRYLESLAKRYNTTMTSTHVDSNMNSGLSYRLKITPEMKKEILKKGIATFKTGGYIRERV